MVRGSDLSKLETWRRRVAAFQSSGLTVVAFCRQEEVTPAQFYYWARRLRAAAVDDQPCSSAKPEVSCANSDPVETTFVELFIGDRVRVRIRADQPELVTAVVAGIAAASDSPRAPSAFRRIDMVDGCMAASS